MRILIAGAGTIGYHLARALASEGQEVVVVDPRLDHLAALENTVDCQLVEGSASSPRVLEGIGIRSIDIVIAVTENDAVNSMICQLADFYRVPQKMARLRDLELAQADGPIPSEHFGIDHVISPELLTVEYVERLIMSSGAKEAVDFERGRIALRGLSVDEDSAVAGEQVAAIKQRLPGPWLLAAIRRRSKVFIPHGQDQLRLGDVAYVIAEPQELDRVRPSFDSASQRVRSALIFGAGVAGQELARRLVGRLRRVVLIEPDPEQAQRAAIAVDSLGIEVLCGSALDEDLLLRCGIDRADVFVGITGDDESNFVGALLFRKLGNGGEPIVVSSQPHYLDILESVDIDLAVNPRLLAVNAILRYLRGGSILSVARLRDEDAEVIEFHLSQACPALGQPLKSLNLPGGALVTAVLRDDRVHIPDGSFVLSRDDRVLVFSNAQAGASLRAYFR